MSGDAAVEVSACRGRRRLLDPLAKERSRRLLRAERCLCSAMTLSGWCGSASALRIPRVLTRSLPIQPGAGR
jgi:hypothetical protein